MRHPALDNGCRCARISRADRDNRRLGIGIFADGQVEKTDYATSTINRDHGGEHTVCGRKGRKSSCQRDFAAPAPPRTCRSAPCTVGELHARLGNDPVAASSLRQFRQRGPPPPPSRMPVFTGTRLAFWFSVDRIDEAGIALAHQRQWERLARYERWILWSQTITCGFSIHPRLGQDRAQSAVRVCGLTTGSMATMRPAIWVSGKAAPLRSRFGLRRHSPASFREWRSRLDRADFATVADFVARRHHAPTEMRRNETCPENGLRTTRSPTRRRFTGIGACRRRERCLRIETGICGKPRRRSSVMRASCCSASRARAFALASDAVS